MPLALDLVKPTSASWALTSACGIGGSMTDSTLGGGRRRSGRWRRWRRSVCLCRKRGLCSCFRLGVRGRGAALAVGERLGRELRCKLDVKVIRSFDQTVVRLLVIVVAGLASLAVLLSVSRRLQDLGRVCVGTQPRDEDGAQRLGRDGDAGVTLEQAADPLRPAARLHGPIKARLRRVEQIGLIAAHLKLEQPLVHCRCIRLIYQLCIRFLLISDYQLFIRLIQHSTCISWPDTAVSTVYQAG